MRFLSSLLRLLKKPHRPSIQEYPPSTAPRVADPGDDSSNWMLFYRFENGEPCEFAEIRHCDLAFWSARGKVKTDGQRESASHESSEAAKAAFDLHAEHLAREGFMLTHRWHYTTAGNHLELFRKELREGLKKAFMACHAAHPHEKIHAYALICDGRGSMIRHAVDTEEAWESREKDEKSFWDTRQWACRDGGGFLDAPWRASTLLYPTFRMVDEGKEFWNACINALGDLDREGFFGMGHERMGIAVFMQTENVNALTDSVLRLNGPAMQQRFGAWHILNYAEKITQTIETRMDLGEMAEAENAFNEKISLFGLDPHRKALRSVAKMAADLTPSPLTEVEVEMGDKLGGMPYLPENFQWPMHADGPYRFIGQVWLTSASGALLGFPENGILWLFYAHKEDWSHWWGEDHFIRAFYDDGSSPLAPTRPPPSVDFGGSSAICSNLRLDLPPFESAVALCPEIKDIPSDVYWDFRLALMAEDSFGHLGGYPFNCTLGYDPTPGPDWTSLLTLRSNKELQQAWHDGDRLVAFIQNNALARGDFSSIKSDAG